MIKDPTDERSHRKTRILSTVAAVVVALAAGTNYAYSAWAPQFADRLRLTTTQSNLIGAAGNIGMYATGIPVGMLVDSKGPRPAAFLGSALLFLGYFPLQKAYDHGPGYMSVTTMSFCSFLTGVGSSSASGAGLKTAALSWPHHRGTATAFPLAAFGLSAFFFTTISRIAHPGDTSSFLLLLSFATFGMVFVGTFFLHIVSGSASYTALPVSETRAEQHHLHRTKSKDSNSSTKSYYSEAENEVPDPPDNEASESSSLISEPGDIPPPKTTANHDDEHHSHRPDISGLRLLRTVECWQLFTVLGLLTGIGLMTINNIGHDAQALWSHYDDSVSKAFIGAKQLAQVSIISIGSFLGRLASGIGSDALVKKLNMSRFWCLVASALIFTLAQFTAMRVENPNHLWLVSSLTGLGYGALFGVFPSIVADAFGVHVMTQNWGFMTLSPVISGNVFNLCYGSIFDAHSTPLDGGDRECSEGLSCYRSAYSMTLISSICGVFLILWTMRHERAVKRKEMEERNAHNA
ncbi:Major facilitator superfamily [Macrophomina phaseolina MS6]|uniref:Major facilitator superfamily n=1 Tax=Macrophomina phaseolina (strain MS6) TaxID=1126212 RepID=K2RVB5_MACPH|nr:Major facilitator superfamily [Macrophomina phaseolina MS6]